MIIYYFLLLILSLDAKQLQTLQLSKVCQESVCYEITVRPLDLYKYSKQLNSINAATFTFESFDGDLKCLKTNSCYLYLGVVGDSYEVKVNDKVVTSNIQINNNFSYYESTLIPIPNDMINRGNNSLEVLVRDLNGYLWGFLEKEQFIGDHFPLYKKQVLSWFKNTGVTLFSAYTMLIFSVVSLVSANILRKRTTFFIMGYCIISFLYLISFSEVPRRFVAPELLSGLVHFPLRFLQDLALFATFNQILNKEKRYTKFYRSILYLYIFFISCYILCFIIGIYDYSINRYIIIIGAPLVALPMGYGLFLSLKVLKGFERNLLLPIFIVLFVFQLNDLFLFWQLINSYFTVKFYIPFIVVMLFFIELKRHLDEYWSKNILAEKVIIANQVAHDIKSPITVLNIISNNIKIPSQYKQLFDMSISRVMKISSELLDQTRNSNLTEIVNLRVSISEIVEEKKIEYPDIKFNLYLFEDVFVLANKAELFRVCSNIINNAAEAAGNHPEITIRLESHIKSCLLTIFDNGIGMSSEVMDNIGKLFYSNKKSNFKNNYGLGLYSAKKTLAKWNSSMKIYSKSQIGTTIEIKFPLAK